MSATDPITISQRCTFAMQVTELDPNGDPVDNTGEYAVFMVARRYGDLAVATCSTVDAGITLGGADGTYIITLPATETEKLVSRRGYVWQLRVGAGPTTDPLRPVGQGPVIVAHGLEE